MGGDGWWFGLLMLKILLISALIATKCYYLGYDKGSRDAKKEETKG